MGLTYGDLFDDWEIALAKKLISEFQAKYPWLKIPDFDDLLQECLIHWYLNRSRFKEGRGASKRTYMAKVVSVQLQLILRRQLSDKRKIGHLAESLERPLGEGEETLGDTIPAADRPDEISLRIDVESVLETLTPSQRNICQLLAEGYPVTAVAEVLGKPRSTVRDDIERIKQEFLRKGLEDYWE